MEPLASSKVPFFFLFLLATNKCLYEELTHSCGCCRPTILEKDFYEQLPIRNTIPSGHKCSLQVSIHAFQNVSEFFKK